MTVERVNHSQSEDSLLVLRARDGDDEAFKILVERYQDRAYWIANGKVHNSHDAMEIAQEAFIRVHRALHRFNPELRFYTWFYQIVSNLSIDLLRRRSKRSGVALDAIAEAAAPESLPSADIEATELGQRIAVILAMLPEKYAEVISLRDLEGMGAKEISEMSGVTHATVRWRLHQARKLFRKAWEERFGESHEL